MQTPSSLYGVVTTAPVSSPSSDQPCIQSNVVAGGTRNGASTVLNGESTDDGASVELLLELPQATKSRQKVRRFMQTWSVILAWGASREPRRAVVCQLAVQLSAREPPSSLGPTVL